MKIAVTGSEGQLGSFICNQKGAIGIDKHGSPDIKKDIAECDLSSELEDYDLDGIVHTAAIHASECIEDPVKAQKVNIQGTRNVIEAAEKTGAHLIFVSSDQVFDGQSSRKYTEQDNPYPLNMYGATKLVGESFVRRDSSRYTIFRTSILYGGLPNSGKGVSGNFFAWVLNQLNRGKTVDIITDQVNNPTYVPNLSEMIFEALEKKRTGLYHAAGPESVTRFEAVKTLKRILNLDGSINRIEMSDLGWDNRPKNCSLDIGKFSETFSTEAIGISRGFKHLGEASLSP